MSIVVCVPVTGTGQLDPRWGRAERVAIARVDDGTVSSWQEHDVHWGQLHDQSTGGAHHARVARFLKDQNVQAVVVNHMGDGMRRMLDTMGIRVVPDATGDARSAAAAVR